MSARLKIIDPLSGPAWDGLVAASGRGTFFHTSDWARVLSESYGYRPVYFAFIDDGGPKALLPFMEISSPITGKRGVSLPFTDYLEPIISGDCRAGDLLAAIIGYGKDAGWRRLELRGGSGLPPGLTPSSFCYTHVLDLSPGEEALFASLRPSTRRNIKKSMRDGVKVTVSGKMDAVAEFYRLNCMTRKQHGLPPQPYRFFKKLYEHCISKGHGMVALAASGGKTIAGEVCVHYGGNAVHKYAASDAAARHLKANDLLWWAAISHYIGNGLESMSLGRTESENEGLLEFKRGWGGQEQVVNYYKYDLKLDACVTESSKLHGFHNKVFANMPIPVLRFAGSLLYKHIG